MKLLPSALLALLLAYSPLAFCGNWECATADGYRFKHCVDTESIKDDGAHRIAHVKMIVPEDARDEDNISYMMFVASFDCENKASRWLSVDVYGKDDKILEGRSETNTNAAYEPLRDDGMSKFFDNYVCGK